VENETFGTKTTAHVVTTAITLADIPMGTGTYEANQLSVPGPSSVSCNPSETSPSASPAVAPPVPVSPLPLAVGRGVITARRGPGRPRLKPAGPGNQGTRGPRRPRKPVRPLPVPLGRGVSSTSSAGLPPEMLVQAPEPPAPTGPGFYCQVEYMQE